MSYDGQPLSNGARALAAAAVLVIHSAAGAALVTGMDGHALKPIERRTLTGIDLPPAPPRPRTVPNPTSDGVPGKLYEPGDDPLAEPVPDAMSWIVPEQGEPETSENRELDPPPRGLAQRRTGCEDCGWWPENDWQYYQPGERYPIVLRSAGDSGGAQRAATPATPANDPAGWIAPHELPFPERYDGNDWVGYSLAVDREGRVADCEIIRRSASAGIDQVVCKLISLRARLKPATDSDGASVAGAYNGTVRWEIPD